MLLKAMLLKIGFVLDLARKDSRFLNDLTRDPFRTLDQSGIDLSRGEIVALIDVVKERSDSSVAPMLADLRANWSDIVAEEKERFGRQ